MRAVGVDEGPRHRGRERARALQLEAAALGRERYRENERCAHATVGE